MKTYTFRVGGSVTHIEAPTEADALRIANTVCKLPKAFHGWARKGAKYGRYELRKEPSS